MAKAYIYLYSGFPDGRGDKYYVCKYGKGRPITYQVVPLLQRHFDAQGREHKETLDYECFKELRRAGHLYTGKREKKRTPLLGDLDPETLPEPWQPLGEWLSGAVSPGDVDWGDLGRSLRASMLRHPRIPEPLGHRLDSLADPDGQPATDAWSRLRRQHLEDAWYHHWPDGRLADMEDAPGVWDAEMLMERLKSYERRRGIAGREEFPEASHALRLGEFPLGPLRQWTSTAALQWPEKGLRRAAARGAGLDTDARWPAIVECLPPAGERYENLGGTRVPVDPLYDVLWEMARRLEASPWAASPWAATGQPGLVSRWHAGASAGLVVTLRPEEQPGGLEAWAESWLSNWSARATTAFRKILVEEGDIDPGSPLYEPVTEARRGRVDRAIADALRNGRADTLTWRYCRMGRRLILSSREAAGTEVLMRTRRRIVDVVRGHGYSIDDNATSTFAGHPTRLEWEETVIPLHRPAEDVPAGDVSHREEGRHAALHEKFGDPRYLTLSDPELRRTLRGFVSALTLRDFTTDVLEGWYGALYDETETP